MRVPNFLRCQISCDNGTKVWLPDEIVQVSGPTYYKVKMSTNLILQCHFDQFTYTLWTFNANEDTVTDNDLDNWTFPSSIDSNSITFIPTRTLPTNSPPAQPQPVRRVGRAVDRFGA